MNTIQLRRLISCTALSTLCALGGCGDSDATTNGDDLMAEDAAVTVPTPDASKPGDEEEDEQAPLDAGSTGDDEQADAGTPGDDEDASTPREEEDASVPDAGEPDGGEPDASEPVDAGPTYPSVPSVLSLSGCGSAFSIPALCAVTQSGAAISANCAGVTYTGTVATNRDFTLTRPNTTNAAGAAVSLGCAGKIRPNGSFTIECTQNTAAIPASGSSPAVPAATATCQLSNESEILPGLSCMELPATLNNVVVCGRGAAAGGTTISAGNCAVIQDGCSFQASCASGATLSGTVTATGVSFNQTLKALANAQTPAATTSNPNPQPAFLAGADVRHTCTATVAGTTLSGSCGAGAAGNGGTNTSTCDVTGSAAAGPVCANLAPSKEHLFALNSCDILKNGEAGPGSGIGEPVCAFRQNNCVWDVQCGNNPALKFGGRLTPGATRAEWTLATGTPCNIGFNAQGVASGACTVPGENACQLSSMTAVPGGASCPTLPQGVNLRSNGCAGGDPLDCRAMVQHGCNFMAACDFSSRYTNILIAGTASLAEGRDRLDFNGIGGYQCHVTKANAAEIASDGRVNGEWYGDCVNPATNGRCRNTYNPTTGTGFRSLRVYFE